MLAKHSLFAALAIPVALVGCGADAGEASDPVMLEGDPGLAPDPGGIAGGDGNAAGTPNYLGSGGATSGNPVNASGSVGAGGIVNTGGVFGSTAGTGGFVIGTGGAIAATGGVPSAAGATGSGPPPGGAAPCIDDPTQVAIIGDSYVTGAFSPALQPTLGAADSSANLYRNYAVPGTSMASGGLAGFIGPQVDLAVSLKTNLVIMDGGGNDILLCDSMKYPGCNTLCNRTGSPNEKVCTDIVAGAMKTAGDLLAKAAQGGVRDVIYFFYPHVPSNLGGFKDIIDYAEPIAHAMCDGAVGATGGKLRCHFVDLVQPFIAAGGDMNPANFSIDGIHPSQAGQDIIAREIRSVMKAQCLGQPKVSGCCAE